MLNISQMLEQVAKYDEEKSEFWFIGSNSQLVEDGASKQEYVLNKIRDTQLKPLSIILFVTGLLFLCYQGKLALDWQGIKGHRATTSANTINVKTQKSGRSSTTSYKVSFSYRIDNENYRTTQTMNQSQYRSFQARQKEGSVMVVYDAEQPEHAFLLGHEDLWEYISPWATILWLFSTAYLPYCLLYLRRRKELAEDLKRDGTLVQGRTIAGHSSFLFPKMFFILDTPDGKIKGQFSMKRLVSPPGTTIRALYLSPSKYLPL